MVRKSLIFVEGVLLVVLLGRGSGAEQPSRSVLDLAQQDVGSCVGEVILPPMVPDTASCVLVRDGGPVIQIQAVPGNPLKGFIAGCDRDLDFTDEPIWLTQDPAVTAKTAWGVYCEGEPYTLPEQYRNR